MRPIEEYKKSLVSSGCSREDAIKKARKFRFLWVFYARKGGMTFSEIGKHLGVSTARANQTYHGSILRSAFRGLHPMDTYGAGIDIEYACKFLPAKININPDPSDAVMPEKSKKVLARYESGRVRHNHD